jgi:hypothetical protein
MSVEKEFRKAMLVGDIDRKGFTPSKVTILIAAAAAALITSAMVVKHRAQTK